MLYIFDIDGTIAPSGWGDDKGDPLEPYPNVRSWFDENYGPNVNVAFASNQGGVGYRRMLERAGKEVAEGYPTQSMVNHRMRTLSKKLTGDADNIPFLVAYNWKDQNGYWVVDYVPGAHSYKWDPQYRKPNPGMLLALADGHDDVIFVGDREEDMKAALAANVDFTWASIFFG